MRSTATNSLGREYDFTRADVSIADHFSVGAFGISFFLPILVYIFAFACNDISGCPAPSLLHPRSLSLEQLKHEVGWPEEGVRGLFNWQSLAAYIGYVLVNAILYGILPAVEVEGTALRSGARLKYRFNSKPIV